MAPRTIERCHNISDLQAIAGRRLPSPILGFLEGGADDEVTLRRNTTCFDHFELVPRALVDVSKISTSVTVMGQKLAWPMILAPTSMSRLFHPGGENAVARAAADSGALYSLSTVSSTSIEEVAAAASGPKLFQLYIQRDPAMVRDLLARARSAGYGAMCITVDVPVAGNRERDFYSGMTLPPELTLMSLVDIALHPRWCWSVLTNPKLDFANLPPGERGRDGKVKTLVQRVAEQLDNSVTWKDAELMISEWGGPAAIKGIMSVDDARRAADIGASAVMVSNHGGRQLDGAPAPIDLIAEITDAVGDRLEVILDGGVRRGAHVAKALALGATACMVGRPYLYGLAAGGEAGVAKSLAILRGEFERTMSLLGCRNIAEITRGHVRPAP